MAFLSGGLFTAQLWSMAPSHNQGERRKYEVYFPGEFTLDQPWGPEEDITTQEEVEISFSKLAHTTHYSEAEIIVDSKFEFKAKEKKEPHSSYSYKCTNRKQKEYTEMPQFCSGYFSWWSIDTVDSPITKRIHSPSRQFKNESIYGTVKFSINFEQIEKSYLESYNIFEFIFKRVVYKKGGTLRYSNEVCYVIIVCIEINGRDPFPDLPTMMLHSRSKLPIKRPSSNLRQTWDTYTFAFHFPEDHPTKSFSLNPQDVHISEVEHSFCLKRIREKRFICPDVNHITLNRESRFETLKQKQISLLLALPLFMPSPFPSASSWLSPSLNLGPTFTPLDLGPSSSSLNLSPTSSSLNLGPSSSSLDLGPSSSLSPSLKPGSLSPSLKPGSLSPSLKPGSLSPSLKPGSLSPSLKPGSLSPSLKPGSLSPSLKPGSLSPSLKPGSLSPSLKPGSLSPSLKPGSLSPSLKPGSLSPSLKPGSLSPSLKPGSLSPSLKPGSLSPSLKPGSLSPSLKPGSLSPSLKPGSLSPSLKPGSLSPSLKPGSLSPSLKPGSLSLSLKPGSLSQSLKPGSLLNCSDGYNADTESIRKQRKKRIPSLPYLLPPSKKPTNNETTLISSPSPSPSHSPSP